LYFSRMVTKPTFRRSITTITILIKPTEDHTAATTEALIQVASLMVAIPDMAASLMVAIPDMAGSLMVATPDMAASLMVVTLDTVATPDTAASLMVATLDTAASLMVAIPDMAASLMVVTLDTVATPDTAASLMVATLDTAASLMVATPDMAASLMVVTPDTAASLMVPAASLMVVTPDTAASLMDPATSLTKPTTSLMDPADSLMNPADSLMDPAASLMDPAASLMAEALPDTVARCPMVAKLAAEVMADLDMEARQVTNPDLILVTLHKGTNTKIPAMGATVNKKVFKGTNNKTTIPVHLMVVNKEGIKTRIPVIINKAVKGTKTVKINTRTNLQVLLQLAVVVVAATLYMIKLNSYYRQTSHFYTMKLFNF
jgi:hypothetical protein